MNNQNLILNSIINNSNLSNKTVILRVDFNVPTENGKILDSTRIIYTKPTIDQLLAQNNKIILISHLGRPTPENKNHFSFKPLVQQISSYLNLNINFVSEPIYQLSKEKIFPLNSNNQIILLENIRFYSEEEKNDLFFSKQLANLGDLYVNEAFSCSHRSHASITGITNFIPSYAGIKFTEEYNFLSNLLNTNNKNLTLIIGGAKIDTKIGLINTLGKQAKTIIIGGALANTFLAAENQPIGNSLYEPEKIKLAKSILKELNSKIILPIDAITSDSPENLNNLKTQSLLQIQSQEKIFDLGPKTINLISQSIPNNSIILWNGPLGLTEFPQFQNASKAIANLLIEKTNQNSITIIGGGDTIAFLNSIKIEFKNFTFVSTSGGAMLEFFEQKTLPGIECLIKKIN